MPVFVESSFVVKNTKSVVKGSNQVVNRFVPVFVESSFVVKNTKSVVNGSSQVVNRFVPVFVESNFVVKKQSESVVNELISTVNRSMSL